jgi:hypothetical protein
MLRLATDADVPRAIIRGVTRDTPGIDLVHSLDVLPEGTPDRDVLAWYFDAQRFANGGQADQVRRRADRCGQPADRRRERGHEHQSGGITAIDSRLVAVVHQVVQDR